MENSKIQRIPANQRKIIQKWDLHKHKKLFVKFAISSTEDDRQLMKRVL